MSLSMYEVSVPIFQQILGGLAGVIDKASAHFAARNIDAANVVQMRLYPDMFTFARQVQSASDHAKGATARLAGVEPPSFPDTEANLEELKARVAKTIDYLKTIKPEQFEGAETRKVVLTNRRGTMEFDGKSYLLKFALPNFYFHTTTAYDLLRSAGVEIGKRDFMGAR